MTKPNIGLIGLGTMGSAFALNIAEKGYRLAVTTRHPERVDAFIAAAGKFAQNLSGAHTPEEMIAATAPPRTLILLVPAGDAVDALIAAYAPLLDPGDTLIDAGNANFHDTRTRSAALEKQGLNFIGMGVSGGEEGARHGPSVMVGGTREGYEPLRPVIEAVAAKFEGKPCAAWLGPDGAGHFVKTVHNGIEYADMQLIAEVYGLLRDGSGRSPTDIGLLFGQWNEGPLNSYLAEITGKVLAATDPETGKPAVDVILDRAGQKGTGRWTVIEALSLGQSANTIEAAVGARSWSADLEARKAGETMFSDDTTDTMATPPDDDLEAALLAARIITYSQGFQVLRAASDEYGWDTDLALTAEIWRAGCIIRSKLLDDIAGAFRSDLPEGRLLFASVFSPALNNGTKAMRRLVTAAVAQGLPVPGFSTALAWFDTMRKARGTTNLIQAQRDFFGAHGFDRIDSGASGVHGPWHD